MNRRIIALFLTLILAVSCSVTALAASFKDVEDPSWYSEAVNYVVEKGYMAGMSKDTFSPNTLVTRAQLTQILYAAEGKPKVSGKSPFTDVPTSGTWYSDSVLWSVSNSMVAGYPDKSFRPNQALTREQLVSVMYRYAIYKNYSKQSAGDPKVLAGFPDGNKVAEYAKPGMTWAIQNVIIAGTPKGLEPQGVATRAQMAVIIRAFMTNVAIDNPPDPPDPPTPPDPPDPDDPRYEGYEDEGPYVPA